MMENTFFVETVTVEKNVQTTVSDMYSSETNCVIVGRFLVISFLGSRDDNPHLKTTPSIAGEVQQLSEKASDHALLWHSVS